MTSYIARSGGQKKKNILHQRELALIGDIRRGVDAEKLQKSAEKVRLAQLGVIKALLHESEPARREDEDSVAGTLLRLGEARDYWTDVLAEEIIEMYSTESDEDIFIDRKKWWDSRPRRN
ncbi:hypothetical protein HAHE_24480 [Haloferula helveola]|uniref:Transcriptional regulator n=1 Tax=Haloferula helveola TaxID=490095 RepID=A0ABM7REL0_9BACT|nr:hypothetical protein HAHE_24480 [Haloferula helveola]